MILDFSGPSRRQSSPQNLDKTHSSISICQRGYFKVSPPDSSWIIDYAIQRPIGLE